MNTENADPNLNWLLQAEIRETYIPNLGREPWITVYLNKVADEEDFGIISALIPNQYIENYLDQIAWDLDVQNGHPEFVIHYNQNEEKETTYLRFGNLQEKEPFIIRRDFNGVRKSYVEILEEFRLFHRLYHDHEKNQLLKFNERGDEIVVVKIEANKVEVRLKELRQFLAVKEAHLAIYFDLKRYSKALYEHFPFRLDHKDNETSYELCAYSENFSLTEKYRSLSRLLGRKIIPPLPLDRCGMWPFNESEQEDYIDFIIGSDQDGNVIKYSCDPDELANYFGANPNAPQYLTPVFFQREVLTKYFGHPERYSVEDGAIRCKNLWLSCTLCGKRGVIDRFLGK